MIEDLAARPVAERFELSSALERGDAIDFGEGFVDWGWLDGDVVYFTLPEDDLKQGRFDRVKMTMECF